MLHPRALWGDYSQVFRTYDFLLSAIPTLTFATIFIYVAAAPTYLVDLLGVSTYGFAWLFIPLISGIMTGVVLSGGCRTVVTAAHDPPRLYVHVRGRDFESACCCVRTTEYALERIAAAGIRDGNEHPY